MFHSVSFLPQMAKNRGLKPASLRDLGPTVVLAGPNGAGKTRYLHLLAEVSERLAGHPTNVTNYANNIRDWRQVLRELDEKIKKAQADAEEPDPKIIKHIQDVSSAIEGAKIAMEETSELVQAVKFTGAVPTVVRVSYSELAPQSIQNPRGLSVDALDEHTRSLNTSNFASAYSGLHVFLDGVARALYNAEHPRLRDNPEMRTDLERALKYNAIVKALLDDKVDFRVERGFPRARLLDRDLAPNELSDGQRVLLAWSINLLDAGATSDAKNLVLVIDEPEKHLHAAACIEVLELLRERLLKTTGQLWLATHSSAVVTHFGATSVYYVERGGISFAGTRVSEVVDGLLGGRDARRAMLDFFQDADVLAFLKFATESLTLPHVADARSGDRQGRLFASLLAERTPATKLRVIDYGAGKGRFAVALHEAMSAPQLAALDYFAYNHPKHNMHMEECLRNLAVLYGENASKHHSSEISDFYADDVQVDVVVMCNFLHEILPSDWNKHFEQCYRVLRQSGSLLLLEDQEIPIGELPTKTGFIVMNLAEVRTLFNESKQVFSVAPEGERRLSAIWVPRDMMAPGRWKAERLHEALRMVRSRALSDLQELREQDHERDLHRAGRMQALAALMHANASLALRGTGDVA